MVGQTALPGLIERAPAVLSRQDLSHNTPPPSINEETGLEVTGKEFHLALWPSTRQPSRTGTKRITPRLGGTKKKTLFLQWGLVQAGDCASHSGSKDDWEGRQSSPHSHM